MRSVTIQFIVAACLLRSALGVAAEPTKVAYAVICDNEAVGTKLSSAIEQRLKLAKLEVTTKLPKAKLIVYAQQDLNDRVNRKGWSFAIAHVTNYPTYVVAAKLLGKNIKEVSPIEPALISMLNQEGFMTYMNVAHTDELSEQNISVILDSAVTEFSKRVGP